MQKNPNDQGSAKKRIQIADLPQDEQELSADEQKNIQGGATRIVRSSYGGTNTATGGGTNESAADFIEK